MVLSPVQTDAAFSWPTTPNIVGNCWARSIQPKFPNGPTGKSGPRQKVDYFFPKLFRLDQTDSLTFGPKFPEILVEWIAPVVSVCASLNV